MKLKTLPLFILAAFFCFIFSCQKAYQPGDIPAAHGSLHNSDGDCLEQNISGTYYTGVMPGKDTAFVSVQVNVTSPGIYTIKTNTENGYYFADSGFFANTGIYIIKLRPYGKPVAMQDDEFSINFDSTTCQFNISVKDSTGTGNGNGNNNPAAINSWEFSTDSGGYFNGKIMYADLLPDSVYWNTIVPPTVTGGTVLRIQGPTSTGDTSFFIYVLFPGRTIMPGTYQTQLSGTDTVGKALFAFAALNANTSIYDALPDRSEPNTNVFITVKYDADTEIVSGTFYGTANNQQNQLDDRKIGIVNGKFSARLQ